MVVGSHGQMSNKTQPTQTLIMFSAQMIGRCSSMWPICRICLPYVPTTSLCSFRGLFYIKCVLFKFKEFWIKVQGYTEIVQAAWDKTTSIHGPVRRLHTKLCRIAKTLKK